MTVQLWILKKASYPSEGKPKFISFSNGVKSPAGESDSYVGSNMEEKGECENSELPIPDPQLLRCFTAQLHIKPKMGLGSEEKELIKKRDKNLCGWKETVSNKI